LVRSERVKATLAAVLVAATLAGCKAPAKKTPTADAARRSVQARVLTVETTLQPGEQKVTSDVVVVGSKVRLTDELDRWRLFDLDRNEVVEVDEVSRTYRRRPLATLLAEKRAMMRTPTPATIPALTVRQSGRTQSIRGVAAHEWTIEFGGYRRELWLSDRPLIHQNFWPLYLGSEPLGGPYPARSAAMHLQLMNEHGFPLLDEIEMRFGSTDMRTRRTLIRDEKKAVDAALVEIPNDFTDAAAKAPAAGRPAASSSPDGRNTPAAESRSF
jgi:hypothetical protein